MTTLLSVDLGILQQVAEVAARVTGLLLLAPVLGSASVPRLSRVALTVAVTAVMLPIALGTGATRSGNLVTGLLGELALGAAIGLIAEMLFAAVDIGAATISFGAGLSYMAAVDPFSITKSTAIMTFQWLMATALFLAIDGHHLLLRAVATSFELVPIGTASAGQFGGALASAGAAMFTFGLALAAPALVILLLIDLAIGMVGRVAPHTHALIIGMGLKPLAAFAAMSLSYGAMPGAIRNGIEFMSHEIGTLLQAAVAA